MKLGFIEILNILTIVWLTFFSTFLFSYKKGNKLSNYFLGWLLITNAFFNLTFLIRSVAETISYPLIILYLSEVLQDSFLVQQFIYIQNL